MHCLFALHFRWLLCKVVTEKKPVKDRVTLEPLAFSVTLFDPEERIDAPKVHVVQTRRLAIPV